MEIVVSYLLIPFLNWGQYFFYIILLLAANKRFGWFNYFSEISYKALIWFVLGFKILYASASTIGQYYVWSSNSFTKLLLDKNAIDFSVLREFSGKLFLFLDNRFGYFFFYSWGRFWFEIIVSLIAALAFYLFLIFLKKYKERFFEEGETALGFLLAFMVGWSNFIVFLPIAFLSVVFISILKILFFKEKYTTLGAPFLLAALIVLIFGDYLVSLLGWVSLRV